MASGPPCPRRAPQVVLGEAHEPLGTGRTARRPRDALVAPRAPHGAPERGRQRGRSRGPPPFMYDSRRIGVEVGRGTSECTRVWRKAARVARCGHRPEGVATLLREVEAPARVSPEGRFRPCGPLDVRLVRVLGGLRPATSFALAPVLRVVGALFSPADAIPCSGAKGHCGRTEVRFSHVCTGHCNGCNGE